MTSCAKFIVFFVGVGFMFTVYVYFLSLSDISKSPVFSIVVEVTCNLGENWQCMVH